MQRNKLVRSKAKHQKHSKHITHKTKTRKTENKATNKSVKKQAFSFKKRL